MTYVPIGGRILLEGSRTHNANSLSVEIHAVRYCNVILEIEKPRAVQRIYVSAVCLPVTRAPRSHVTDTIGRNAGITACLADRADLAALLSNNRLFETQYFEQTRTRLRGYQGQRSTLLLSSLRFRRIRHRAGSYDEKR